MALRWQAALVLLLHLHSAFYVQATPIGDDAQESYRKLYHPQIQSVLNYLNSEHAGRDAFRLHNFVDATRKTDDVTAIELDVADVLSHPAGHSFDLFTCTAIVKYYPDGNNYVTLPGVECHPIHKEELPTEAAPPEPQHVHKSDYCPGCTIDLDTNVPGVDNLIATALHHLEAEKPRKHAFVRVLRLQREIVAGVKFILYLEVAPTVCDSHAIESPLMCALDPHSPSQVCRIEFVQKPWISNDKHIISNNCTSSQDFAAVSAKKNRNDFDNEIDVNNEYKKSAEIPEPIPDSPNYEKMAETGNLEPEVSPSRLLDIEAQIIPTNPTEHDHIMPLLVHSVPLEVETTKFGMDNSQLAVEDVPSLPTTSSTEDVTKTEQPVQEAIKAQPDSSESQESTESSEVQEERVRRQTTTDASSASSEESDEVKLKPMLPQTVVEETTSEEPTNQERRKRQTTTDNSSSSEESNEVKPQTRRKREVTTDNSSSSEESNEAKPKNPAPKKKRQATTDNSSSSEESNETKPKGGATVSEQPAQRRKRSNPDEDTNNSSSSDEEEANKRKHKKYHSQISKNENCNDDDEDPTNDCATKQEKPADCTKDSSSSEENNECHREKRNVRTYEEERELVNELAKFGAESIDDDTWRHQLLEVQLVKKVELEGAVYHMVVRYAVQKCNRISGCFPYEHDKLCQLMIHYANGHAKLLKSRCHKIKRDVDKNRSTNRNKRQVGVPGAPVDSSSNPDMLNYAKESLVLLDSRSSHSNKYKLVQLRSATTQVVAGMLHKLTVDIVESDCLKSDNKDAGLCGQKGGAVIKTCVIEIWDRPWLPNGKETKVKCDDERQTFKTKRSITYPLYDDPEVSPQLIAKFASFKRKYNKQYTVLEESYRFKIFNANMKKAEELNKSERGSATYGASRFADLSEAEFKQYLGYRPELRQENAIPLPPATIPNIALPTEFDWRTKGAVTHVKDQGSCGSCWAFSVTGNVEGQYAIKHDKLLEFSEQELVDCDKMDNGCDGGLMDNAYRAIEALGGLELESDYPYDAEDEKCAFAPTKSRVQLTGAVNVSSNEDDMAKFLLKNGPISIAINANAMQLYMGGVSHPLRFLCDPDNLDHGVLIVGYGIHKYKLFNKELPYWIVKNSWGASWGEQGYYRVYRGDGTCGVNKMASSAIVA